MMRQVSAVDGVVSLTKVALRRPASVCPTRIDNSSVAKARSYATVSNLPQCQVLKTIYTLARGTMARNETMDELEATQGGMHRKDRLTNKDQGIVELEEMEYPLRE
jgi:hypothetical protein